MNEFEDDKLADELREQGFTDFDELRNELFEEFGWRDHIYYRWHSLKYRIQVRITMFFIDLAQKICNHMFCSIHEDEEGYFEVCTICGKRLEADD